MYDLIIKNASVLDGTGADAFYSDIAIKDGKIAKLGEGIEYLITVTVYTAENHALTVIALLYSRVDIRILVK